jgi:hypothetical protein
MKRTPTWAEASSKHLGYPFEDGDASGPCPKCGTVQTLAEAEKHQEADALEYRCVKGCGTLVRVGVLPGDKTSLDVRVVGLAIDVPKANARRLAKMS